MSETQQKLARLRDDLGAMGSLLVCFSGGIDSALLLKVAHDVLGARALGMTAVSPSLPPGEREAAAEVARAAGAAHVFVDTHEIDKPGYQQNGADRCFHCKTELYDVAAVERERRGLAHVAAGIITEDLGDHRPGLDAARAHGVRFPLVDAGFTKGDVRAAAEQLGLSIWNKPASACLSSRIPYGTSVTRERLSRIGGFEAALKALGLRQLRVRYHETGQGDHAATLARVELALDELPRAVEPGVRDAIVAAGREHGFRHVTLDLAGYRMGSANELLSGRSLRVL